MGDGKVLSGHASIQMSHREQNYAEEPLSLGEQGPITHLRAESWGGGGGGCVSHLLSFQGTQLSFASLPLEREGQRGELHRL